MTREDILHLNLSNCRLVTLSACETGIPDFNSISDEYISLSSGFILAGSPNVINAVSTALLMIRFYQNLKQGETVTRALKKAQIWLREVTAQELFELRNKLGLTTAHRFFLQTRFKNIKAKSKPYASPYYWAGFCVIGA